MRSDGPVYERNCMIELANELSTPRPFVNTEARESIAVMNVFFVPGRKDDVNMRNIVETLRDRLTNTGKTA